MTSKVTGRTGDLPESVYDGGAVLMPSAAKRFRIAVHGYINEAGTKEGIKKTTESLFAFSDEGTDDKFIKILDTLDADQRKALSVIIKASAG
ncbi:hypothetical protein [Burkholderia cenocepacia]|uniref:hypothetical protein n=2 Tax=Burkholderia cenocepacia TaxID=95486 RepID=UPI000B239192|nr:hypothetical protein [Burkholderia cenocepacia]